MDSETGQASPAAYQELNTLIQTLHEQGLLSFANNAAASHPQWTATVARMGDDFVQRENLAGALPAFVAFARLLQQLHRMGLLELARNAVASYPQWTATLGGIVDDATRGYDGRRLFDNIAVIAGTLSRIEPEQLNRFSLALGDCLAGVAQDKPANATAPGLLGVYRMCRDETLWRTLAPMIDAMKVFGRSLEQKPG